MVEIQKWEYRVENLGSLLKGPRDQEIQDLLNEWGNEGWEIIVVTHDSGTSKMRIFAKRPLTDRARRRRSMPG